MPGIGGLNQHQIDNYATTGSTDIVPFRFVMPQGNAVQYPTAATDNVLGISQAAEKQTFDSTLSTGFYDVSNHELCPVLKGYGIETVVTAGDTIAAGDQLATDNAGRAVPYAQAGYIIGRAREAAVVNDLFRIVFFPMETEY